MPTILPKALDNQPGKCSTVRNTVRAVRISKVNRGVTCHYELTSNQLMGLNRPPVQLSYFITSYFHLHFQEMHVAPPWLISPSGGMTPPGVTQHSLRHGKHSSRVHGVCIFHFTV